MSLTKGEHTEGRNLRIKKADKNTNSHHLCLHYHHWQGYNYQVHTVFWNIALEKDRIKGNVSLPFFGGAAVDGVKVSAILSGKAQRLLHGSISNSLTGTHTNTQTHTGRMQNEAAAPNNLPDRLSDTKTHRQKGKTVIMWGWRGIVVGVQCFFIRKKHNIFHSIKRTRTAQTEMVISITLHEAAVWWNGVAARQRQAVGHYTTPERGGIIAEGEYNQVLCLSLL